MEWYSLRGKNILAKNYEWDFSARIDHLARLVDLDTNFSIYI